MMKMKHSQISLSLVLTLWTGIAVGFPLSYAALFQPALAQTREEDRKAEALRLVQQGIEEYESVQFQAAIDSWEAALKIYREIDSRLGVGGSLYLLGDAYRSLGQYQQAIAYYQQSSKIFREIDYLDGVGSSLNNLGNAYHFLGQYQQASAYFQQSLEIFREIDDLSGVGRSLNNLGNAYHSLGQYRQAIEYHQQSLEIDREIGNLDGVGTALNNLGNAYYSLGQYRQAIEYFQQSLEIFREIGDREGVSSPLTGLGSVYNSLGQSQRAIEYFQQSLEIDREIGNRSGVGISLNGLGIAYHRLGQFQRAIAYFQQSLEIFREIGNRSGVGNSLNGLGIAYNSLGQFQRAIEYHQQSMEISSEIGDPYAVGSSLGNLGNVYESLGQYQQAIAYFQQSLEIFREIGERLAESNSWDNLGSAYHSLGQYQQAIEYHQQSMEISREIGDLSGVSNSLNGLGIAYNSLGQFQRAIEYHQQSLEISREIGSRLGVSSSLNSLGNAYLSLGQYQRAIEYYQQSLEISREIGSRLGVGSALNNLGLALFKSGNLPAAEKNLLSAIEIRESIRSDSGGDTNKVSVFETQAHTYRYLQQILIAQNKTHTALEIAERGRAKTFIELLASRVSPNDETPLTPITIKEIQRIAQEQNTTIVEYSRVYDKFEIEGKPQVKESELYIWVIKPTGEITFRQTDLKPLWQQHNTSLQDIVTTARESIAKDGAIAQNHPQRSTSNPSSFAPGDFVREKDAIPNTQPAVVEAVNAEAGTLTIKYPYAESSFTISITDVIKVPSPHPKNQQLQHLHQLLIAPIADLLPTNPEERIIFIPQDSLFSLPFPALQDAEGNYLIQKHTILTAPAIQMLAQTRELKKRESAATEILVVGNPTMPEIAWQGKPSNRLSPLPHAETEAEAIARFHDTEAITGDRATKAAILEKMPAARIIHLATHGLLDDIWGLGSAIVFAASEDNDDDNELLTAEEITTMKLQAELVVLSACDTGRGRITGDGVIGLSRSLVLAGVPSVMVSLWNVNDKTTEYLMTEFYRQQQHDFDKAKALRQAMLTTMKEYPSPKDWAAFTLIGEAE